MKHTLNRSDLNPCPFKQFQKWFDEAIALNIVEPNAMALATVGSDGHPHLRMVLLKAFDTEGFVFFTNYRSPKSQQLQENPRAALVFFWKELERQVRIEGTALKTSLQESQDYFKSRPKGSQIASSISPQSQVITSKEVLEKAFHEAEERYKDSDVPPPPHWGGFRVIPTSFQFWQGAENRMSDRFSYRLEGKTWIIEQLAP